MKTIVIIGGSKGIGNAILKKVIETNYVINISRTAPTITHNNLTHYNCDILTDELPNLTTINTLIYCPGSINLKTITRLTLDDFQTDFNINVMGAIKAIKKYVPLLKEGKNPSILLFSTVAVKLGMPFHSSIAASKGAIEGLVKSLAAELAPTIRVNAIAPTVTNTELASKLLRNDKMKENITERHPLKKYLNTEEVAATANFLIANEAASMSGQIFQLDCGIVSLKI
jgi:NAD(P)-dependent dehydrogenase (short-subunit alcohol dehydrogenase family)